MLPPVFGVLFDGLAYGMLLFVLSVGLSVTLGLMNFVNLAHCAFAMLGGYVTVTLVNDYHWPFLATLPAAFVASAAASVVLERILYRRLYRASDLDQVLLTIGIAFISVAVAAYIYGTDQQPVHLPSYLQGSLHLAGLDFAVYRLVLIAIAVVGGIIDTVGSFQVRGGFNIGIVVASVVAILMVKRSHMFPIVIAPPIVYSLAAVFQLYLRSGGLHDKRVVFDAAANYLVYGFPAIAAASAAVLIIAGIRMFLRK